MMFPCPQGQIGQIAKLQISSNLGKCSSSSRLSWSHDWGWLGMTGDGQNTKHENIWLEQFYDILIYFGDDLFLGNWIYHVFTLFFGFLLVSRCGCLSAEPSWANLPRCPLFVAGPGSFSNTSTPLHRTPAIWQPWHPAWLSASDCQWLPGCQCDYLTMFLATKEHINLQGLRNKRSLM